MTIEQHPLSSFHPSLVSNDNFICTELNTYYNQAKEKLVVFRSALEKVKAVDPNLKDEIRLERQQELMDTAFNELMNETDTLAQPFVSTVNTLIDDLERSKKPTQPDNTVDALRQLFAEDRIHRELMAMPQEKRSEVVRQQAALGNPLVLSVCRNSLAGLVSQPTLDLAESSYLEATQSGKLASYEIARAVADSTQTTRRFIPSAAVKIAADAGLEEIFKTRTAPAGKVTRNMTDAAKTAFINENGLESFLALPR